MNDSYGSMEALETETVNPIECSAAILADLLLKVFKDSKSRMLQVRISMINMTNILSRNH